VSAVHPLDVVIVLIEAIGFDKVFLEMVQSIQTDQDRKDVIVELEKFTVRHYFSSASTHSSINALA
jgi:hypothetical protein